jgi:serine/threonine protein kinase
MSRSDTDLEVTFRSQVVQRGTLEKVELIAAGGMAQIFRAWQPSLERYVVIKKLKDEFLMQDETLERFRREARALASVLHENIAHVYDFVDAREPYLLMEFIDGVDVSDVITKLGNIPGEVAACILLGVAKGASFIHSRELVHRDIKPSNIRLTTRGEVKLMDFGIALNLNPENEGLTRPGLMVGSPSYLSPEQILGDAVSAQSDIFLLGVTLYEMLTGAKPFKDSSGKSIFQKIREASFVPVREMNRTVSPKLEKIVKRCLMARPEDRYESVRKLISDLEDFLGPEQAGHPEEILLRFLDQEAILTPAIDYHRKKPAPEKKAPFNVMLAVMFAVGLLVGVGGGLWWGRSSTKDLAPATPAYPPPVPAKAAGRKGASLPQPGK